MQKTLLIETLHLKNYVSITYFPFSLTYLSISFWILVSCPRYSLIKLNETVYYLSFLVKKNPQPNRLTELNCFRLVDSATYLELFTNSTEWAYSAKAVALVLFVVFFRLEGKKSFVSSYVIRIFMKIYDRFSKVGISTDSLIRLKYIKMYKPKFCYIYEQRTNTKLCKLKR